jgi:hypothetical protein
MGGLHELQPSHLDSNNFSLQKYESMVGQYKAEFCAVLSSLTPAPRGQR